MTIMALLVALILIAIVCVITSAAVKLIPGLPAPLITVIWAIVGVICLLILLAAITGTLAIPRVSFG